MKSHGYLSLGQTITLGPVRIDVLWPPSLNGNYWDQNDENNNSLVLAFTLDKVRFVLSGDCLAGNWDTSKADHVTLPRHGLRLVQVPHHGARNGLFDQNGQTPMLSQIASIGKNNPPVLALSCHTRPHSHPNTSVIQQLDGQGLTYFRTDEHYHLSYSTDGTQVEVSYSHI